MVCDNCKNEYKLIDLWYDPYAKKRYCKSCYERITQRIIYEPAHVDFKGIEWEEE